MREYMTVATSRLGKIEDVALCNSYTLARDYAERFAKVAPPDALVTVYECKTVSVSQGLMAAEAVQVDLPFPTYDPACDRDRCI